MMAGLLLGLALATPADAPTAVALRTRDPIRLDGVLDEAAWGEAVPIGALAQREPKDGVPAAEATEIRVLYDAERLYFGVTCRDREAGRVVATQLARDADLFVDDHVILVLDPFFDHRNGFFFVVNPLGARADGQISNNAEHLTLEWDGIWDARARRTEEGWTAEVAVPFKTLRFKPGQTVWGLNVERRIQRLQETDRWAAPRHDAWIGNLSEAGLLTGLEGVQQGKGLDLRPFVSGGEEQSDAKLKAGLDVFKNLTPNLNASLTLNTDFAETEVDARQVNLTRFELFLPEKRAFFLEGAGVYDVAGLGSQNEDLIPFFSRSVGLLNGQEAPILVGAKLSGRVSDTNVGFLDVQTRRSDDAGSDGQNLLAARVSRNLFEQSWVGGIFTRGNPTGEGDNTLVGADVRLATSRFRSGKNLSLDLYAFRTDDAATGKVDYAGGFKLDYPNDRWDVSLSGKQIGTDFRAALGFVPRAGVRIYRVFAAFQPRPERLGIRRFFFELEPTMVTNLANRVESWRVFTAPFNCRTQSGEHLEWNVIPQYEHLREPFEIAAGTLIPSGAYRWTRYRAELNTAPRRPWVVDLALWWGGFYDGRLRTLEAGLTLKPSSHLSVALRMERNEVALPEGAFVTRILSARGDWNFSPKLAWSNLVQYDSESRILGAQSRFRWTLKPGNDLFVVANRGFFRREDGDYVPRFDRGSAKLQYTIRL
jgi:hypothetical protein